MKNLNEIVNRLLNTHLSLAVHNHSFFVNDVPGDLPIDHQCEWISSVISGLLATVTDHARNTCIRLSARKHGHIIVFTMYAEDIYGARCLKLGAKGFLHKAASNDTILAGLKKHDGI